MAFIFLSGWEEIKRKIKFLDTGKSSKITFLLFINKVGNLDGYIILTPYGSSMDVSYYSSKERLLQQEQWTPKLPECTTWLYRKSLPGETLH
jgi:hypothetical protein